MSILIKGMEMPKCEPLMIRITPDGEVHYVGAVGQSAKRARAIEIPPHGRLIDADVLRKCIPNEEIASRMAITNALTIIEAEE